MSRQKHLQGLPVMPHFLGQDDDDEEYEISFVDVMGHGKEEASRKRLPSNFPTSEHPLPPQKAKVRRRTLKRRQQHGLPSQPETKRTRKNSEHRSNAKPNKENLNLRDVLVSQMDIIKHQNEDILKKERKMKELQRENEKLRQKLKEMAMRPLSSFTPRVTEKKKSLDKAVITDISDVVQPLNLGSSETKNKVPETKEVNKRSRKRLVAKPSHKSDEGITGISKKLKASSLLYSQREYFVQIGEKYVTDQKQEIVNILRHSETPQWREKVISPAYSLEGTENIEDDLIEKRHSKPLNDEKRRKRWDLQIMREQRNVERLKARYSKNSAGSLSGSAVGTNGTGDISTNGSKTDANLNSILQGGQGICEMLTHIEVTTEVPVNSFGFQLPDIGSQNFTLPWLSLGAKNKKK